MPPPYSDKHLSQKHLMSVNTLAQRPTTDEYFTFYESYIRLVPDGDVIQLATDQLTNVASILAGISEDDAAIIHQPYTWTIKQVLGHIIDAERIFADRLHRISAGDSQPQLGMDQDIYVKGQDFRSPRLSSLAEEWQFCRRGNLLLMQRIQPESWNIHGTASGYPVTVRALAWMIVGHVIHHMDIVVKRLNLPTK